MRAATCRGHIRGELQVEGAGIRYPGFAGVAALDAADAKEFLAAALEVGFNRLDAPLRHDQRSCRRRD